MGFDVLQMDPQPLSHQLAPRGAVGLNSWGLFISKQCLDSAKASRWERSEVGG